MAANHTRRVDIPARNSRCDVVCGQTNRVVANFVKLEKILPYFCNPGYLYEYTVCFSIECCALRTLYVMRIRFYDCVCADLYIITIAAIRSSAIEEGFLV